MMSEAFPKNPKNITRDINYMMELLRRVYDVVEMCHLTDYKLSINYVKEINFPRCLGEDIFNYLSAKDQTFRDTVIKRQNRFRKRLKNNSVEQKSYLLEDFKTSNQQLKSIQTIDLETINE